MLPKKYILVAILLFAVPLVSAYTATTSVSVRNIESMPLRYWVDDLGPVEYDAKIGEFLSMYPKGCSTCQPVPYWDSNNPNNYVISLTRPAKKYIDVPVRLELDDANGYDDITKVTVSELVDIKNKDPPIAPFPLNLESGSVTRATYSNTFRLYKNPSSGPWRIQFSIRDRAGVDYTAYGYFYLGGNNEKSKNKNTKASSWWDLFGYLGIFKKPEKK